MKDFISISNVGSIRILNIPLVAECDYVKKVLRTFDIQENNNCLYLDNVSIDNLPPLNIRFNKDKEGRIDGIYVGHTQLNQKECDALFEYFKKHLSVRLNVFSDKDEEIVLTNHLHRVSIGRQKGIGNDENKYPFFLHIAGRLMGKNEPELRYAIKQLYLDGEGQTINKPHTRISTSQTIKVLFLVFALIIAFLFALNGRYIKDDNEYYFDKWTKKMLEIQRYDTIR